MTKQDAVSYAVEELPKILPLNADQVESLCEQTISDNKGNPEGIAQSFFEILGQNDLSVHFIFEFNEKLVDESRSTMASRNVIDAQKTKSVLKPVTNTKANATLKSLPKKTSTLRPVPSNKQPIPRKKEPPAASDKRNHKSKDEKAVRLNSLKDIDNVLKMLEVKNVSGNVDQYKCNCQGTRYPIFEPAPNCLSCGKIICIKEGLHMNNCSFCGAELIPQQERAKIIELLQMEKDQIELKRLDDETPKPKSTRKYKITSGAGTNLWQEQEKMLQRVEKDREQERENKRQQILNDETNEEDDEQLNEAKSRLEKLLHFQDTSAERTKIIDNASDFAMDENVMWGSAYERALQLKKQQRNARRWEKIEKERNRRSERRVVLDLTIGKDGKAVLTEAVKKEPTQATSDDELNEISDEEDLEDLMEIKDLKEKVHSQKRKESSDLIHTTWDYKKAQSEFTKPIYTASSTEKKEIELLDSSHGSRQRRPSLGTHRVQVSAGDESTLQDNIISIL